MKKAYVFYLFFFLFGILTVLATAYFYKELKKPEIDLNTSTTEKKDSPEVPISNISQSGLQVPPDYTIDIFAQNLGKVKVVQADNQGNIYATIADQGRIVAFKDNDRDGKADLSITIVKDLNQPNGLQIICQNQIECQMFVAQTDQVTEYKILTAKPEAVFVKKLFDLPDGGLNDLRSLKIVTIDGKQMLMVGVGSSCNVCEEKEKNRATVLIAELTGTNLKVYASGLRNPTAFAQKNENIYVTDVGRDWLGDNLPNDEVNLLVVDEFYGWPYCYNDNQLDASFKNDQQAMDACTSASGPKIKLPAHSGPTGIAIGHLPKSGADNKLYESDKLFVALHGSWNRSVPSGYKVIYYEIDQSGNLTGDPKDFITGFIQDDEIKYRPTDIFINGFEMYVTDDHTGKIFVIRKNG